MVKLCSASLSLLTVKVKKELSNTYFFMYVFVFYVLTSCVFLRERILRQQRSKMNILLKHEKIRSFCALENNTTVLCHLFEGAAPDVRGVCTFRRCSCRCFLCSRGCDKSLLLLHEKRLIHTSLHGTNQQRAQDS